MCRIGNDEFFVRHFLAVALFLDAHVIFPLPPREGIELDGDDLVAGVAPVARTGLCAARASLVRKVKVEIVILLAVVFRAHPQHEGIVLRGE